MEIHQTRGHLEGLNSYPHPLKVFPDDHEEVDNGRDNPCFSSLGTKADKRSVAQYSYGSHNSIDLDRSINGTELPNSANGQDVPLTNALESGGTIVADCDGVSKRDVDEDTFQNLDQNVRTHLNEEDEIVPWFAPEDPNRHSSSEKEEHIEDYENLEEDDDTLKDTALNQENHNQVTYLEDIKDGDVLSVRALLSEVLDLEGTKELVIQRNCKLQKSKAGYPFWPT